MWKFAKFGTPLAKRNKLNKEIEARTNKDNKTATALSDLLDNKSLKKSQRRIYNAINRLVVTNGCKLRKTPAMATKF